MNIEQVQAEVARFWSVFISKNTEALEEFYAHESSVFSTTSSRTEPGRLAAIRREREYFQQQSTLRAQTGLVEVHLIGDRAAVAAYTFQFHATRAKIGVEHATEEHVVNGRATQVFELDLDDQLRIVHEHFSIMHRL